MHQAKKAPAISDETKRKHTVRNPVRTDGEMQVSSQELGYLEDGSLEPTVENHAALLANPRLSHPANAWQKARIVNQLQQHYGNGHVQKVVQRLQASAQNEPEQESLENTVEDLQQQRGSGHPMKGETHKERKQSLGYDFGHVRIHTEGEAHRAAGALDAKAFTKGADIILSQKQGGNLSSSDGRGLLAHELTNVVQQSEGNLTLHGSKVKMGQVGDRYEREADVVAEGVVMGEQRIHREAAEEEEEQMLQTKAANRGVPRQAEGKDGEETLEAIAGKKRNETSLKSGKNDTNIIAPSPDIQLIDELIQESPPDQNTALLKDPRLSLPPNTEQRAREMTPLQQQYGNKYVQRIYQEVINSEYSNNREELTQKHYASSPHEINNKTGVNPNTISRRDSTYASSEEQTYVQRNEKPTAGLTLEAQGNKVKVEVLGDFPVGEPIKLKYATYKVSVNFGGSFEVAFPGGPEPQPGESPPPTKELKPVAKEAALKYAKRVWEKKKGTLGSVESIDFVSGIGGKRGGEEVGGGHGGESGFAVGIKIKLAGNIELSGILNVVKLAEPKSSKGMAMPFEIQGPSLEGGGKIELPAVKDHPWGGYKLTGSGVFGLTIIAEPVYTEIAIELMEKYAPQLLQRLGMTALQAVRNIMASGPALIGFLGAYITVKATLATLEDWSEEKRVVQAANQACAGFRTGFMTGLGVEMSAGDPAWYTHGAEQARAALMAQVTKIQAHPLFKPFNFTELELIKAMKDGIRGTPGPFMKLAQENEPRIKALYIQQWRQNLTWAQKTFTSTESAERRIKYMLGLDIDEPLPEAAEPPPAEPVEPTQASA